MMTDVGSCCWLLLFSEIHRSQQRIQNTQRLRCLNDRIGDRPQASHQDQHGKVQPTRNEPQRGRTAIIIRIIVTVVTVVTSVRKHALEEVSAAAVNVASHQRCHASATPKEQTAAESSSASGSTSEATTAAAAMEQHCRPADVLAEGLQLVALCCELGPLRLAGGAEGADPTIERARLAL